jgi:DNA topoisomerase VI subunit B
MAQFVPADASDKTKVDASPTKEFFVDIITRDIQLDDAIQDLIDNCIDGAKRLRPGESPDYQGLWVKIEVSNKSFRISDNCGGIPLEIAKKYAFKFGRAKGFKSTSHSVGQFGVGMKRALFKMGEIFSIKSKEPNSEFVIKVNVPEWVLDDANWDFSISHLSESHNAEVDTGTDIEVTQLESGVSDTFGQEVFVSRLRHGIRVTH